MGEMDMEDKNITMADMVVRIILENQLSSAEEDQIWDILGERKWERYERQGCRCLAEYAEKEMGILAARDEKNIKEKAGWLCRLCLRESRIGSMDIAEFSAGDIRKLIILTAETRILDREDTLLFLVMLQHTLNMLARKGVLGFTPSKTILSEYRKAEDRITFVSNPYKPEEVQKITEWIDANPYDMRGLAVGIIMNP